MGSGRGPRPRPPPRPLPKSRPPPRPGKPRPPRPPRPPWCRPPPWSPSCDDIVLDATTREEKCPRCVTLGPPETRRRQNFCPDSDESRNIEVSATKKFSRQASPFCQARMSDRVLSVTVASASGHVIVERFYERLPETIQMMWRRRLHEASEASLGERGSATLDAADFARVEEGCGVARHGEDCMVWCGVGDLRFYAVGSGQYDEFGRASSTPPPPVHPPSNVPSPPSRARPRNHSSSASPVPPSPRRFAHRTPRPLPPSPISQWRKCFRHWSPRSLR